MKISQALILEIQNYLRTRYRELEVGLKYWREKKREDKIQELTESQGRCLRILDQIRRETEEKN